ncbi:hypothetical protein EK21DRAFT_58533 [Setomelanomma holmii]|uniref:Uncharacterized protein n=1 Tax=Setomelanomma holmii TaxID=210430 RepID=A0A9P4HI65_9PLEO|nr:hypothetical protein EK21DRAFT_58533 [Setomelanomma holmii]
MSGCEWRGRLQYKLNPETAAYGYFLTVTVPHHNHLRAPDKLAYFQALQRDKDTLRLIQNNYEQNKTARSILATLLSLGENVKIADVKNEVQKLRRDELAGRTHIEALVHFIEEHEDEENQKYFTKVDYDAAGYVRNLF